MLMQTINGFDLLLIMVIVGLVWRVVYLNRACEDYERIRQMLQVSWELQDERKNKNG